MNPESKDFAPGGSFTSAGFCAESASVVTSCSVFAVFCHSTVVPTGILRLSGWYCGGLSVIVTTTVLPAARAGGEQSTSEKAAVVAASVRMKRLFMVFQAPFEKK